MDINVDVEKVIREYLPKVVHLSLGTSNNNIPWVCEVHFAYDENLNLYFRSLSSRRHSQDISHNPKVAGNIVVQHKLEDNVLGVYFEGSARLLEKSDEQKLAFKCINERLHTGDNVLEEAARSDGHQFYKITVENYYVFGRFGQQSSTKHKLVWNGGNKLKKNSDARNTGSNLL